VCGNDFVIMGDFNYPGINWQTLDCVIVLPVVLIFLELVQDTFLVQQVLSPTRGNNQRSQKRHGPRESPCTVKKKTLLRASAGNAPP